MLLTESMLGGDGSLHLVCALRAHHDRLTVPRGVLKHAFGGAHLEHGGTDAVDGHAVM